MFLGFRFKLFESFTNFSNEQVLGLVDLLRFTVYLYWQVFDDDLKRKDEKISWVYLEIQVRRRRKSSWILSDVSGRWFVVANWKTNRWTSSSSSLIRIFSILLLLFPKNPSWTRLRLNCEGTNSMMRVLDESLRILCKFELISYNNCWIKLRVDEIDMNLWWIWSSGNS